MPEEALNQMQRKAPEPFKPGKSLVGKGGAFAPIPEQFLEVALESDPEAHLDPAERSQGNKRNGNLCEIDRTTPRCRKRKSRGRSTARKNIAYFVK